MLEEWLKINLRLLNMKIKSFLTIATGTLSAGLATKIYSGPRQDFIRFYGWDSIAPIYFYTVLSTFPPLKIFKKPIAKAIGAFAFCSAGEICQNFGLYGGTYDSKDFLAYAAGAGLALSIDLLSERLSKNKNIENKIECEK